MISFKKEKTEIQTKNETNTSGVKIFPGIIVIFGDLYNFGKLKQLIRCKMTFNNIIAISEAQ